MNTFGCDPKVNGPVLKFFYRGLKVAALVLLYLSSSQGEETDIHTCIERFHRGRGLLLLLAVATGFYMQKVPSQESLPPKY